MSFTVSLPAANLEDFARDRPDPQRHAGFVHAPMEMGIGGPEKDFFLVGPRPGPIVAEYPAHELIHGTGTRRNRERQGDLNAETKVKDLRILNRRLAVHGPRVRHGRSGGQSDRNIGGLRGGSRTPADRLAALNV